MSVTISAEKDINLDELQQEAEKLLALLKDRQPGLISWNEFMRERLTNLYTLISKALGKSEPITPILRAEINTDIDPRLPFSGAKIEKHARQGKVVIEKRKESRDGLYIDGQKVILWRSVRQINGKSVVGYELRKEVDGQQVLCASILDFLVANQEYIPEEWKEKDEKGNIVFIFFWATIYRNSVGSLCVRCLCWDGGRWYEVFRWLDFVWCFSNPAAVLASISA